jgi:hypothetical protein
LVSAAEYVGILKFQGIDLWSVIGGITMWGMDTPSIIARSVITGVVLTLVWFISSVTRFLPVLQR